MDAEKPHHKLQAWKTSMELATVVYDCTTTFPAREHYCLTAQIRRSAISIPSNLAEGAARSSRREFANFLNIARGSLSELETQLLLAVRLGYLQSDHSVFLCIENASKLLTGLHRNIARAVPRGSTATAGVH